jgi:histidinol dehydrogenase
MNLVKILVINEYNKAVIFDSIKKRNNEKLPEDLEKKVEEIITQVKKKGNQGLLELTRRLDHNNMKLSEMEVTKSEFEEAKSLVKDEMLEIIKESIKRIKSFHRNQLEKSWLSHQEEGMVLGQLIRPLERVGVYVPGGTAEYPSSLIMGAVPALIAGVKEIYVATPLGSRLKISPYLLMTAHELGIAKIYKVGGAQAIAALAYGTETIKPVDKIVGPGNMYVTIAKKQVFGQVDIDMLAGPSEILIWAEKGANTDYIIADLFSQAEHDEDARAVLVTTSKQIAEQVQKGINQQIAHCQRKDIITSSLTKNGRIILAEDKKLVIDLINEFAPEHLELQINDPWSYLGELKNFGAVFLGQYSPEPLGDYWAGPNHILPTMGSARQFSVLSVHDFLKRSSVIYCRKDKLLQDRDKIARLADLEGLPAHAHALRIRE